jgi:hypothetical protein
LQVAPIFYRRFRNFHDDVFLSDPSASGRTAFDNLHYFDSPAARKGTSRTRREWPRSSSNTYERASNAALSHQRSDDPAGAGVDGDRKAQALADPWTDDGGVDADHTSCAVG